MLLEITIQIKFDNVSRAKPAKKSAKKCVACSEFLFCLLNLPLFHFLISIIAVVALSSPVALYYQPNDSQYAAILREKPTIKDGKCTMKSTSACTHTKARSCLSRDGGGAGGQARGGGRGDMPKTPPLSQTSKAKDI